MSSAKGGTARQVVEVEQPARRLALKPTNYYSASTPNGNKKRRMVSLVEYLKKSENQLGRNTLLPKIEIHT